MQATIPISTDATSAPSTSCAAFSATLDAPLAVMQSSDLLQGLLQVLVTAAFLQSQNTVFSLLWFFQRKKPVAKGFPFHPAVIQQGWTSLP